MASPVPGSLEHLADAEPARVAIVGDERTLTRGEWDARACALADGLQEEFGLAAGDRVGIAMAPGPEYLEVTFALAKLGAAPVGIAPRDSDEVAARLVAADAELLIADDAALADAHGGLAIGGPAEDLIARRRRDAPRRLSGTEAAPPSVTFDADGRALVHEHEPERLAAVGQALGALVAALGIHAGDVHLFAAPTHLGASTLFAGVTLIAGGTVVATADPKAVTIARHGITTAYLTRAAAGDARRRAGHDTRAYHRRTGRRRAGALLPLRPARRRRGRRRAAVAGRPGGRLARPHARAAAAERQMRR